MWDYKTTVVLDNGSMCALGRQGWRLVAVAGSSMYWTRPARD